MPVRVDEPPFEAVGDGVHDDTDAIQAAITYAGAARGPGVYLGPNVLFGAGRRYLLTRTIDWGPCSLTGENEHSSVINWGGPKGVPVFRSTGLVFKRFQDLHCRDGKPSCWIDASADVADFGGQVLRSSFWELDPATADAALVFGEIVNSHHRDVRFDVGNGYCVRINHYGGGNRSFSLDGITVVTSTGGAGKFKGVVNLTVGRTSDHVALDIRKGRIESSAGNWANPSALVVVTEAAPNVMGLTPASVRLDNVTAQLNAQSGVAVLRQETAGTASGSGLVMTSCQIGNLTDVLSGSWTTLVTKPPVPSGGLFHLMARGRQQSSPTNTNTVDV